LVNIKWT